MALLFPAMMRVETAAGVPISGGKCRVYDANTTTLSSLFSDEALTTPLTNPVVADSNGFLPAMFCAESTYDIAFMTAASVLLTGQAWTDWPTFRAGTANAIEYTLSGARFNVSGGDIGDGTTGARIQAGDPSPDDTGGNMRLGGWDGTQGDKLVIDYASIDTPEKSLKEGGRRIVSVLSFEAISVSGAAEAAMSLINDPTGTRRWRITFYDLYFSASNAIWIRLSYDSGATYKSGVSDYSWSYIATSNGAGVAETVDGADSEITVYSGANANAAHPMLLEIEVITPNSGNGNTLVTGRLSGYNSDGAGSAYTILFSGLGLGNYGRATHLKLLPSAGTMTGKFTCEQIRGFGE